MDAMKGFAAALAALGAALVFGALARSAVAPAPSFAKTVWYRVSPNPSSVVIQDLNGDGKPDLAVVNAWEDWSGGGTVSARLNRGDGTFQPRRDYFTGAGSVALAAGDLNGDGVPDLTTANAGTVSVLRHTGDGTFAPSRKYESGAGPYSAAGADLNGDGKPDLVVSHSERPSVSVLLNAGDGTFLVRRDYKTGTAEVPNIAVADMNGDGHPDLLTPGGGGISLLLNAGDGTFEPPLAYRGGSYYGAVAVGDLNGDGRPDIAATAGTDDDENTGVLELSVLIDKPGGCNLHHLSQLTLTASKEQLARANCRVGSVARKYSKSVKQGLVISQSPAFG